jgi:uncharacterized protein (TIGR01619 family)
LAAAGLRNEKPVDTMTDDWASYFCNVNEKLASIYLNLGLASEAPIASKPWLLWVWVCFQTPRPDGLSDTKEAPTLFLIEDALILQLERACKGILSGRITTEGRREFYFYSETQQGFRSAVEIAFAGFRGYRFDLGEQEDSSWTQYFNVLYPSRDDLQRIKNRQLLDVLQKEGNVSSAAREVQHWIYFPSELSRASFREEATNAGFRIGTESKMDGDHPFGITVLRTQPVQQELIDNTVIELLRLAEQFHGEYDGWETPIIADSKARDTNHL